MFYVPFDKYIEEFLETTITYNVEEWESSYFLRLDDDGEGADPGHTPWCGEECYMHTLVLTSFVDQTVYLTANTWDNDRRAEKCYGDREDGAEHSIFTSLDQSPFIFDSGAQQLDPIEMQEGQQIYIVTEWDFRADMDDFRPKDWSVTAWGEKGLVTIVHTKGLKSQNWPNIQREGGDVIKAKTRTGPGESTIGRKQSDDARDDAKQNSIIYKK